jgi:hypothetical protein
MSDLSIICTGRGEHAIVELVAVRWNHPDLQNKGFAVWDYTTRPKNLVMEIMGESTRPNPVPSRVSRTIQRAPIEARTRADGGRTLIVPPCPRCSWAGREMRDTKLREYMDETRDTPNAGSLDVSRLV